MDPSVSLSFLLVACVIDNSATVSAFFDHSYDRTILPAPFILGSTITERQLAGAQTNILYIYPSDRQAQLGGFFTIASTGNTGNGTSNNTLTYGDTAGKYV